MSVKSLICLCLFIGATTALVWPEIPTKLAEFFTYGVELNGQNLSYIGLFTAPDAGQKSLIWNVKFAWNKSAIATKLFPEKNAFNGYPNLEAARKNIEFGYRGQIFVRFVNIVDELPKLTYLSFNGNTLHSVPISGNLESITDQFEMSTDKNIRSIKNTQPRMLANLPILVRNYKLND
ncbi:uncharacterized protein LOC116656074 [Drosophila ananassae]|uniref:uncharacterized protein LOC116656074 n=1 Tax=Drosophila ananassae TaxID=7217 RepID=UPI0013A5EE6E|nr:uncharacterized protein LOC116656074 [Drosophila ananassae]